MTENSFKRVKNGLAAAQEVSQNVSDAAMHIKDSSDAAAKMFLSDNFVDAVEQGAKVALLSVQAARRITPVVESVVIPTVKAAIPVAKAAIPAARDVIVPVVKATAPVVKEAVVKTAKGVSRRFKR